MVDWHRAYMRRVVQDIEEDERWLYEVVAPRLREEIADNVHVASESQACYEAVLALLASIGIPRPPGTEGGTS